MRNYRGPGHSVDCIAPTGGVVSGGFYIFGVMAGVAGADAAAGERFALHLVGLYELPKGTGAGSGWTTGTAIYWNDATGVATETSSGAVRIGAAVEDVTDGATTALVRLSGSF